MVLISLGVPTNVSPRLIDFDSIMKLALFVTTLFIIAHVHGAESRYVEKIRISKGLTAVVAEGDLEPRSIGSFTVRFYRADDEEAKRGLDVDDFAGGILIERDGEIEKVESLDLDGDSTNELIISVRSAGSGGYLSGFAVGLRGKRAKSWLRIWVCSKMQMLRLSYEKYFRAKANRTVKVFNS